MLNNEYMLYKCEPPTGWLLFLFFIGYNLLIEILLSDLRGEKTNEYR